MIFNVVGLHFCWRSWTSEHIISCKCQQIENQNLTTSARNLIMGCG